LSLSKLIALPGILREMIPPEECAAAHKTNRVPELIEQSASIENERDESSSDSSDGADSSDFPENDQSLDSVLASLRREVRCLNDLNASLKSPALNHENNGDVVDVLELKDVAPHLSYTSSIRENFPNASLELTESLGECNFRRYQHLLELRIKGEVEREPLDLVEAVNERPATTEKSGNDDSGYGTLRPPTVYAPSAASSRLTSLMPGEHSRYPPLPEAARSGTAFDCLACGRDITAKDTRQWR
jgi:hypothetical protein